MVLPIPTTFGYGNALVQGSDPTIGMGDTRTHTGMGDWAHMIANPQLWNSLTPAQRAECDAIQPWSCVAWPWTDECQAAATAKNGCYYRFQSDNAGRTQPTTLPPVVQPPTGWQTGTVTEEAARLAREAQMRAWQEQNRLVFEQVSKQVAESGGDGGGLFSGLSDKAWLYGAAALAVLMIGSKSIRG